METRQEATFGEALRHYRQAAGLTQEELAERAGMSVRGLNYLEHGRHQPYHDTVQCLVAALGLVDQDRAALVQVARRATLTRAGRVAAQPAASSAVLPFPTTALLGREHELATLPAMLCRADVRLLTLTGPAGVGKTHLAVQVAATVREQFADGVVFVDLAPLRDAALVLPAIAQILSVREMPGQPLLEVLRAALHDQERLVVLDNCEQVVSAAPQLAAMVAACPRLRLLATSRLPLRLRAEQEYPLAPLALPDLAALPAVEELVRTPAVALFVARAQAIKPGFALTTANAAAVAEICIRLDGLPLAIELAAARVKLFTPQQLVARLERRLPLLISGARDLPERQRTMRAAIAWSHDLLTVAEQTLFRRLAVFVGGGSLDAVLAVSLGEAEAEEGDVLAWLEGLVDHSLLRVDVQADEKPRCGMLETLHEYAWERLEASAEAEAIRRAHAHYYLALAEEALPHLDGPEQGVWLTRLGQEQANLRAALGWLWDSGEREQGLRLARTLGRVLAAMALYSEALLILDRAVDLAQDANDIESLTHLTALVGMVHSSRGTAREGAIRVGAALQTFAGFAPSPGLAQLYAVLADLCFNSGHYSEQLEAATRAAEMARVLHNDQLLDQSEMHQGFALALIGRSSEGLPLLERVIARAGAMGDLRSLCDALDLAALQYMLKGVFHAGDRLFEQALLAAKRLGDHTQIAHMTGQRGISGFLMGDWPQARRYFDDGVTLSRQVKSDWALGYALLFCGYLHLLEGERERASQELEESVTIGTQKGDLQLLRVAHHVLAERDLWEGRPEAVLPRLLPLLDRTEQEEQDVCWLLPSLARTSLALGDLDQAEKYAQQAVDRSRRLDHQITLPDALRARALVALRRGALAEAERAVVEGEQLAERMGYPYARAYLLQVHGQVERARGEAQAARERLAASLALFRRLGARKNVEHAECELAELTD